MRRWWGRSPVVVRREQASPSAFGAVIEPWRGLQETKRLRRGERAHLSLVCDTQLHEPSDVAAQHFLVHRILQSSPQYSQNASYRTRRQDIFAASSHA